MYILETDMFISEGLSFYVDSVYILCMPKHKIFYDISLTLILKVLRNKYFGLAEVINVHIGN